MAIPIADSFRDIPDFVPKAPTASPIIEGLRKDVNRAIHKLVIGSSVNADLLHEELDRFFPGTNRSTGL